MHHSSTLSEQTNRALSLWVIFFLVSLIIPFFIFIGPLRLTIYRAVLLVGFLPLLFYWLNGKAGRIRLPDICILVICVWSSISLAVVHGAQEMVEAIGIIWIETLGAYLLGRCFIRTPGAFFAMTRIFFRLGLILLPFALFELITGKNLILRSLGMLGPVYWENIQEGRLGLERVQGPFAHPIHFGVFFGVLTGMFYFVLGYGKTWMSRVRGSIFAIFLCFSALSSGPLLAAMMQIIFLLWDGAMRSVKSRWYIFGGLASICFVVIDVISNRTPFHVVISYLALNESTAYNRIRIWQYGTDSIWANPIFGIGLSDDWVRPYWMVSSVDMFWILPAMRHGVIVWVALLTLFFGIFVKVMCQEGLNQQLRWYRMGYLFSMAGMFAVGWTVHFWDALYCFTLFFMASGVWFLDWKDREDDVSSSKEDHKKTIRYTRYKK